MAQPTDRPPIAALDIGSSKVSAIIARLDDDGRLTVLGTGQRESRGVKRGFITDMAASEHAVREAVELAERMAGQTVEEVWASYGAGGLVSDVANVEVELGGHAVEQADIDQLMSAGKDAIDRNGQVVLHAHPALYTIDRAQGVQQPIGLHASRLGVDIHVIAAEPCRCATSTPSFARRILAFEPSSPRRLPPHLRASATRSASLASPSWRLALRSPMSRFTMVGCSWACARSRSARVTSPTTSPPPSQSSAATPSVSNASTAQR